ncbi:MAG TPA: ABC transporter permease, partial [Acidilobales archaeon]|nr:ABC transporter permease [Acidilobales archaeon]
MFKLVVVKRVKPLPLGGVLIPTISIIMGILLAAVILYALAGTSPLLLFIYVGEGFVSIQTLRDFVLLTMLGTALVIAFSGAVWNIGEEGQITMGMMAAAYIALFTALSESPPTAKLTMILLALVFGGIWGLVAGVLKAYLT